jgi:DNA-binding NarL/FixJ family response regulator
LRTLRQRSSGRWRCTVRRSQGCRLVRLQAPNDRTWPRPPERPSISPQLTLDSDYLTLVALIGRWPALEPARAAVGDDQEDADIESLSLLSSTIRAWPRLAILGPRPDWTRCDRWLRRGCAVYLDADNGVSKVSTILHISAACDVVIADACFRAELDPGERARLIAKLTGRETEVVRLLSAGLSNRDIAARLSLSEHTVEFHVSNILGKLAARSRGEAAEHARVLGL